MKFTASFCNREYNTRAMIPEHAEILARWAANAREARRRMNGAIDLYYGSSPNECLDLFPARKRGGPIFVFIHGGYWRSLDKSDFSWIALPFVERGVNVALVNYDLAPAVGLETITLQVLRSLEWIWRSAETRGHDPQRIFVGGHAAGGHLAAMAMCALWPQWDPDLPADLLKGAVSVSGIYDLEPLRHASFLDADLKLDAARAFRLSPAWMPPATDAPLLTAVGANESSEFRRQEQLIAERWPRNATAGLTIPGCNHLTVLDQLARPGSPIFEAALAHMGKR